MKRLLTTDNQEELFYSVDIDDRVLGSISRKKAHSDKKYIHRGVGILVFNDQGQLLMQQRSLTKDLYPGVWGISAGGHVTYKQSYDEAAERELVEELGIISPLAFLQKFLVKFPRESEIGLLYKTIHNGPFKYNRDEIKQIKFFKLKDLEKQILEGKLSVSPFSLVNLVYGCGILQGRKEITSYVMKIF